jgi:hypothetical protein
VPPAIVGVSAVCDTGASGQELCSPGNGSVETRGIGVPLSEDEQRILREIEARLYEESPELVRNVASTTVSSQSMRQVRLAVVGFVAGVVVMIGGLSVHYLVAFAGFLMMFASIVSAERSVRRLGRGDWAEVKRGLGGGRTRPFLNRRDRDAD